jgi:hypothetical protein
MPFIHLVPLDSVTKNGMTAHIEINLNGIGGGSTYGSYCEFDIPSNFNSQTLQGSVTIWDIAGTVLYPAQNFTFFYDTHERDFGIPVIAVANLPPIPDDTPVTTEKRCLVTLGTIRALTAEETIKISEFIHGKIDRFGWVLIDTYNNVNAKQIELLFKKVGTPVIPVVLIIACVLACVIGFMITRVAIAYFDMKQEEIKAELEEVKLQADAMKDNNTLADKVLSDPTLSDEEKSLIINGIIGNNSKIADNLGSTLTGSGTGITDITSLVKWGVIGIVGLGLISAFKK